jgi:preprotein translocase subunit SecB
MQNKKHSHSWAAKGKQYMSDDNNENPVPEERFTSKPDETTVPANSKVDESPQSPALAINGQYIKDFSFEAPNTPEIFNLLQTEMPNIQVDIDVQGEAKGDNLYEVVLKVRAEANVKNESVYICELSYAGLFTLNVPQEHLGPVLMIECPLILFPFLRRVVADVTGDGGFAPLMLSPVDFAVLYQQRVKQAQDEQENNDPAD